MPDSDLWTIDRLCELVAARLVASDPSQPSARVREVPDQRTIRWYTTIGLLDRPAEMRGRTALYGPRHLLQVVAIKRLQATGVPLAEVQTRLAGATNGMLAQIAGLPDGRVGASAAEGTALSGQDIDLPSQDRQVRFWAAAAPTAPAAPAGVQDQNITLLPAIRLGAGVTLTLSEADRMPDADDVAAIRQAARPLLDLLHVRGLDAHNTWEDR
jgi:DNA-binding transcriptional MerR regulator